MSHLLPPAIPRSRHRAALVTQRWHACVHVPHLCRSVRLDTCQPAPLVSLASWLLRHGRDVRSLRVRISERDEGEEEEEREMPEMEAQLHGCLAAAPCLEGLHVLWEAYDIPLRVTPSIAALTSLRSLRLKAAEESVRLSCSLHSLRHLTALEIKSYLLEMDGGVRLPPSIERLTISVQRMESPPPQASWCSYAAIWQSPCRIGLTESLQARLMAAQPPGHCSQPAL